jgi:signal peptidase I
VRIDRERLKREAREWAEAILVALVLTLIIRTFVVQAFKIPSGSMNPTLLQGDKLFVNKFIYRFRDPRRWEIIVFKYPEDPKKDFIKRVVAFEGEEVELRDGALFVNGHAMPAPDGMPDVIYYNQEPFAGEGQKIVVPEDSYFVLGDNSLSSRDSRYWGFVPKKYLVGLAVFRWWPPRRIGRLDG